jgi:hypothetical protein
LIQAQAGQFKLDIAAWADKAKGRLREFAVEAIQDINEEVVRATPVKTGFLRGSWWASLNASVVNAGPADPSGASASSRMNASLIGLQLGDVYRANNGAAYAMRIEFGFVGTDSLGRKYNQQPRAFVRGTLDRAPMIAQAAAARVAARA